jgi:hypothetical protein
MTWTPAEAFKDIARGDAGAEAFLGALYIWVHKQDDLFDRDHPVSASVSAGIDLQTLHVFATNPFFQKHQTFLMPVLVTSALSWVASETLAKSDDVLERITAQVLKSEYQNVFFAVAFLIGGWEHATEVQRKYREYCMDNGVPKNLAKDPEIG